MEALLERVGIPFEGPSAPPRRNGELHFADEWESQCFGMVTALIHSGHIGWDEFEPVLLERIGAWGDEDPKDHDGVFYSLWISALEELVVAKGLCDPDEIENALAVFCAPHSHDEVGPMARVVRVHVDFASIDAYEVAAGAYWRSANESENVTRCDVLRSGGAPGEYLVYEVYPSEDACTRHLNSILHTNWTAETAPMMSANQVPTEWQLVTEGDALSLT